jgi:hypothetical protein
MRASVNRKKSAASFEEMKPVCQVLILHEDFPCYSHAVGVCHRLMERFASELDFSIKCWSFIELADPNCARHAAKNASCADIILFAVGTVGVPAEVERWLRSVSDTRVPADGVVGLIVNNPGGRLPPPEALIGRLEDLALRLRMDFKLLLPGHDAAAVHPPRLAGAPGRHSR